MSRKDTTITVSKKTKRELMKKFKMMKARNRNIRNWDDYLRRKLL